MRTRLPIRLLAATLAVAVFGGCEPVLPVEGRVVDIRGQALPGVAVTLEGTTLQTQTDRLGHFRLPCPSSYFDSNQTAPLSIAFIKTGYGSAQRTIHQPGDAALAGEDVALWPLPQEEGVFLLEDYRYRRMTPATVRQYLSPDRGPCFGTKKTAELATQHTEPPIYTYHLYGYDLQLVRLVQVSALELSEALTNETEQREPDETIWIAAEPVPVVAAPIDEPERLLYEVRPSISLAPGHYAVHWGALDGFTRTEARIFLFTVRDPEAVEADAAPSDAAPETAADAPNNE